MVMSGCSDDWCATKCLTYIQYSSWYIFSRPIGRTHGDTECVVAKSPRLARFQETRKVKTLKSD